MSLYLIILSRTLIGVLLIAAAVLKMTDFASFRAVVRGFALIPEAFTSVVALVLPFLEAATGLAVLKAVMFDDTVARWGCVAGVVLFFVFGMAISINLGRGRRNISCGCFSNDEHSISWSLVFRNALLCGIALAGFPSVHGISWHEYGFYSRRLDAALVAIAVLLVSKLYHSIRVLRGYGRDDLIPNGGVE